MPCYSNIYMPSGPCWLFQSMLLCVVRNVPIPYGNDSCEKNSKCLHKISIRYGGLKCFNVFRLYNLRQMLLFKSTSAIQRCTNTLRIEMSSLIPVIDRKISFVEVGEERYTEVQQTFRDSTQDKMFTVTQAVAVMFNYTMVSIMPVFTIYKKRLISRMQISPTFGFKV